jgi:hypothetical protein
MHVKQQKIAALQALLEQKMNDPIVVQKTKNILAPTYTTTWVSSIFSEES